MGQEKLGKTNRIGRPPKDDAFHGRVQARVSEEAAAVCRELGGASFVRELVEQAADFYKKLEREERHDPAVKQSIFQRVAADAVKVPYTEASVSCGYPDQAFSSDGEPFSFSEYLRCNDHDTYVIEARGDSMVDAGVYEGDMLVIDRAVRPRSGDIVLAMLNGDMTLKRIRFDRRGRPELHPENAIADYPVIKPEASDDFSVQGVLTGVVRRV